MVTQDIQRLFRVLLIEDTLDDEQLALRALRTCGRPLAVRVARNGFCAQRALGLGGGSGEDSLTPPDLVISDLKLPGLDGHQLLCLARGDAFLSRIPFLIFTSSNEPSDIRRCLECGADAFVQKPVDYQEYLQCLQRVVSWALDGFRPSESPPCVVTAQQLFPGGRRAA